MKPALLLVDLQEDFLARPRLSPPATVLVRRVRTLLDGARALQVPVMHCHTRVAPDGADRMPHWQAADTLECAEGTRGVEPPAALRPREDEAVFTKRFFSAFGDASLERALLERGVDTLIVVGCYAHACVRTTALDAYARGLHVWIAADAVGTTEPDHAEITRLYLEPRGTRWLPVAEILARLGDQPRTRAYRRRDPRHWATVAAEFNLASDEEVAAACSLARRSDGDLDAGVLGRCADLLEERSEVFARGVAEEVGKPIRYARAEVRAAVSHMRSATALETRPQLRPHGVVALVTPWNNPIAIPLGKIAPALRFGNAVVWKAACEAPGTARAILALLREAGVPEAAVRLLLGDAETARAVIDRPEVRAVSLTGSIATGRAAAVRCLRAGQPFQAELGGNNATVVLRDYDFEAVADGLARDAFASAGQRCTATRRFLVDEAIATEFEKALAAATAALRVGDPLDESTEVGPLVSRQHRDTVQASLEGCDVVCGGTVPGEFTEGCWLTPAVVRGQDPESRLAQEETFGPVALVIPVRGFEHALAVANGVEHGLAATLLTGDAGLRSRFADRIEAGIVKFTPGPFEIDAAAPFGGWKASGLGPPEHGRWDREFYTRPQARYGGS